MAVAAKKDELDRALDGASPNVGIAFSVGLFAEFWHRGWLTLEEFGVLGGTLFHSKLPAYNKTHFVFQTWGLPDFEFLVGKYT
jgi:hypothetical protein